MLWLNNTTASGFFQYRRYKTMFFAFFYKYSAQIDN